MKNNIVNFKPKDDWSEHIIIKNVDGKKLNALILML